MALVKCKDCGKDVSTMATACPNCGRPVDDYEIEIQPIEETSEERIPCPDGNCTGIIRENGICGTCGKRSEWEDSGVKTIPSGTEDSDLTQAKYPREKPSSFINFLSFAGKGFLLLMLLFAAIGALKEIGILHNDFPFKEKQEKTGTHMTSTRPNTIKASDDRRIMAFVQCKNFVRGGLKSPSSADFPIIDYRAFSLGDNQYRVESHVDSQNSFGAKIRSNYICIVEYRGGDEADIRNWRLIGLNIK